MCGHGPAPRSAKPMCPELVEGHASTGSARIMACWARCAHHCSSRISATSCRVTRASARFSSSFTSDDDRYVDDRNRGQHHQHDDEADRSIDQVRPDRPGCANDQTKPGKPQPQCKRTDGRRRAADPGRGVVISGQPSAKPALSVGFLAPWLLGDHSLKIPETSEVDHAL
jgi:hypothetical protein